MPCYSPITAYKAGGDISFSAASGGARFLLPCGRCSGCRLERSRQWAVRCMHEASFHEHNQFLTLTYNEENLPYDKSISVFEIQKFFRKARRSGLKFRYFAVGEYGSRDGRPHYHALIFGHCFSQVELERFWPYGFSYTGDCTFDSAAYCARYCMKKVNGDMALEYYRRSLEDGTVVYIQPEFMVCSRRPGIGRVWAEEFLLDSFSGDRDSVVVRGRECRAPRYYDKVLRLTDESLFDKKKLERVRALRKSATPGSLSPRRLLAAREVREARLSLKGRK